MKLSKFNDYSKIVSIPVKKYKFNPDKKVSKGQKILQDFLLKYVDSSFLLQELRLPGSLLRIDLVLIDKKAMIEYSPNSHHNNFNKFFHKNRLNYLSSLKRDIKKQEYVERNGYKFIEINETDLDKLSYDFFVDNFDLFL
jgi:hypothetical protein